MKTITMTLTTGFLAAVVTAAPTWAAPPLPPEGALFALLGEIRGQVAEVELRAKTVLPHCDDAEDVRDELAQLIRDLNRFDQRLSAGVRDRNDLDRLARLAERVHDHADELKEELADAIEDLQEDGRIQNFRTGGRFQEIHHRHKARDRDEVHYVGIDLDDLEDALEDRREALEDRREERREALEDYYEDLEDRFDDFDDDDFRRRRFVPQRPRAIYRYPQPRYRQPRYYQPWAVPQQYYQPRVYQPRPAGVRVRVGRFGPRISFSSGVTPLAPSTPKLVLPPPPVTQPVAPVIGLHWQQVHDLKASVSRLHALTFKLHRMLCR